MKGIKTISVVSKKVKKGYIEREMLSLCSSLCLSKKNLSNLSMKRCIPITDLSLPFRGLSMRPDDIETNTFRHGDVQRTNAFLTPPCSVKAGLIGFSPHPPRRS